jgi:toxin FitB
MRRRLEEVLEVLLVELVQGRFVPLDALATREVVRLAALRQTLGIPVDLRDTLIAAISLAHHVSLSTRTLRHFQDLGPATINPFQG